MGCNCKKTAENAGKLSDDKENGLEIVNGFKRIPIFILRLFLTILAVALVIVILPFFILYIFFCMIFGKEIRINLHKLLKRND